MSEKEIENDKQQALDKEEKENLGNEAEGSNA